MTRLHPLLIPDWRERLTDNARALGLTPRQTEVALLMVEGLTYPQIAERLCLSESSIKNHAYLTLDHLYRHVSLDLHDTKAGRHEIVAVLLGLRGGVE